MNDNTGRNDGSKMFKLWTTLFLGHLSPKPYNKTYNKVSLVFVTLHQVPTKAEKIHFHLLKSIHLCLFSHEMYNYCG